MTVALAAPVGAVEGGPGRARRREVLAQAELDLVTMTNRQRANVGLIAYRVDPDLMAIARDRALVMAANDVMSHTEPDGRKVWDRLSDANITYYGGARDHRLEQLAGRVFRRPGGDELDGLAGSPRRHRLPGLQLRRLRSRRVGDRQALLRRPVRQGARRDRGGRRGSAPSRSDPSTAATRA